MPEAKDSLFMYRQPQPKWVHEFEDLPLPKLGDLPDDPSFQQFYFNYYTAALEKASRNPSTWRYDSKDFIKLRDFLHLPGKSLDCERHFCHGIPVSGPDLPNNPKDFDCMSDCIEDNIWHMHDLLNDIVLGKVAGPFPLEEEIDHVIKCIRPGKYYKTPLVFAHRSCKPKLKRRKLKGRRVTDLTGNGLNDFQDPSRAPVNNLPSLKFILSLLSDKSYCFDYDYEAAYRNIPYECQSWGLISYVYDNKAFIDLSLTFGFRPAAQIMCDWGNGMRENFKCKFKPYFTPTKEQLRKAARLHEEGTIAAPVRVLDDKGTIYMDDDIETDFGPEILLISAAKDIVIEVCNDIGIKTDLKPGPPKQEVTYLGWLFSLKLKAIKLPAQKQSKIITRLNRFLSGKVDVKTGDEKSVPFLYSPREIAALTGSLLVFINIHHDLKHRMTPFYRLLDLFDFKSTKAWDKCKRLNINSNYWLKQSLSTLLQAVKQNAWVPFATAARHVSPLRYSMNVYSDAAGEASRWNKCSYGMGGICWEARLAWQMKRSLYLPYLRNSADSNKNPDSISSEELLAQQMSKWLIARLRPDTLKRAAVYCWGDNYGVQRWLTKGIAKHAFQSNMIAINNKIESSFDAKCVHPWIRSDQMEVAGADSLSRRFMEFIFGLKVVHVKAKTFAEFKNSQFFPGMTTFYANLLRDSLPSYYSEFYIDMVANFACLAKQSKTNKKRLRNAQDTKTIACRLNLSHYLPKTSIAPTDAALAVIATEYAINHYYVPKTISDKCFGFSPFTTHSKNEFPFLSLVLKGIRRVRTLDTPVGVVLGKDVLDIFNSVLKPEENYLDLLLVTFDWISTTTLCRTGELAPDLSQSGALDAIVTLDKLRIGNT